MQYQTNPQLELAFDFLQYTSQNIFLTGKPENKLKQPIYMSGILYIC